jgi:hypothetical protein
MHTARISRHLAPPDTRGGTQPGKPGSNPRHPQASSPNVSDNLRLAATFGQISHNVS